MRISWRRTGLPLVSSPTLLRRIYSIAVVAFHLELIPSFPSNRSNSITYIQDEIPQNSLLVLREVEVPTQITHVQPSEYVFLRILLLPTIAHHALATLLVCLTEVDIDVAEDVV